MKKKNRIIHEYIAINDNPLFNNKFLIISIISYYTCMLFLGINFQYFTSNIEILEPKQLIGQFQNNQIQNN